MTAHITTTGKRFLFDRCVHVVTLDGVRYFMTASKNIVRENANGTWEEIPKATVQANIMLLPYNIALELFPEWFAANPETI